MYRVGDIVRIIKSTDRICPGLVWTSVMDYTVDNTGIIISALRSDYSIPIYRIAFANGNDFLYSAELFELEIDPDRINSFADSEWDLQNNE